MSYVLQLWTLPLPADLQDAVRIHADLGRRHGPSDRGFQALAQALTARHPGTSKLDDDADGDDPRAVWSDGGVDGLAGGPCWSIGIVTDHVDTVQPFVVETATARGFVVFDDQQGCCYLPGGWTLTHKGRESGRHLGRPLDTPLTGPGVERVLMPDLEARLAPHGFRHDAMVGGLWHKAGDVLQRLSWKTLGGQQGTVLGDIEIAFVSDLMRKPWTAHEEAYALASGRPKRRYEATARTTLSRIAWFASVRDRILLRQGTETCFRVDSAFDVARLAWLLRQLADDYLPRMLQQARDLEHLSFWMHDPKPATWRTMTVDEQGVSRQVEQHLLDTVGCGGPAASVMLAWASSCPDLAWVRRDERQRAEAAPPAERTEALLRLDLVERSLKLAGL